MDLGRCVLCKKPAEMSYCVDPEQEKLLCGYCFGSMTPDELNKKLGVKCEQPVSVVARPDSGGGRVPDPGDLLGLRD